MKHILLIVAALSIGSLFQKTFAQYSIVDEDNYWTYYREQSFQVSGFSYAFKFQGDVIINGKTYKELFNTTPSSQTNWVSTNTFFREDSLGNVFINKWGMSGEEEIYSFKYNEGDTVVYDSNENIIEIKDSIQLLDGSFATRYKYLYGTPDIHSIEGIGSTVNMIWSFGQAFVTDLDERLQCFYRDGNLVYQHDTTCFVVVNTNQADISDQISIHPSPVADILFLDLQEYQAQSIDVFSIEGQLVKSFSGAESRLDISSLPSGMFLLKIGMQNGDFASKRFIKIE